MCGGGPHLGLVRRRQVLRARSHARPACPPRSYVYTAKLPTLDSLGGAWEGSGAPSAAVDVMRLARAYEVPPLVEACGAAAAEGIASSSVLTLMRASVDCAVPRLGDACLYFLTQGSNLAGLLGDGSTDAADQLVVTLRDFLERRLREGGDEATSGAKDSPLAAAASRSMMSSWSPPTPPPSSWLDVTRSFMSVV